MGAESEKKNQKAERSKLEQSSFGLSALDFNLKIGYDGKRAVNNFTGLGNYSRSLIEQLAKKFRQNQYFVYSPKAKSSPQINAFLSDECIHLKLPQQKKFLWRSFGIIKDLIRDDISIYHGLSHEIPFGINKTKIKSVVTVHDLIFLRFPHYFKFIDRTLYNLKCKYACKTADKIIAISNRTKQDIIKFYGIKPDKIEVIYQTCDDSFKKASSIEKLNTVRQTYQLPDKYILSVGTIEQRKNLLLVIKALKNINIDYKLVVIGKQTSYFKQVEQEIAKHSLQNRVIFLKNIPFADLPSIYQLAKVFVYPSFYEGFGIPIIEALYSRVPVIAATGSCLEEAGGPSSLYVSPTDSLALANSVNQILENPTLQDEMKVKGLEFVQKFNSDVVTNQLMNSYLKILSHD